MPDDATDRYVEKGDPGFDPQDIPHRWVPGGSESSIP